MWTRIRWGWFLLWLGGWGLLACARPASTVPPETPAPRRTTAPTVTMAAPTRTPTATPEPVGVVLAPEGADPEMRQAAMQALRPLAAAQGWTVAEVNAVERIPAGVRLVLALPPTDGAVVAQALGETPVVVLAALPEAAPPNLFSLDGARYTSDRLAFAAGYLAALQASDYRVGALFRQGEDLETQVNAFGHGMQYFCGLCRPAFPPFEAYPVWATLPPEAETALWAQAAETLVQEHGADLVYVASWSAASALAETEAAAGVHFLGVGPNPPHPQVGHVLAGGGLV